MAKQLIINGVKWADYEIESPTVFMKIYPNTVAKENIGDLEDLLTEVISLVENTEITQQAFLNI